MNIHGTVRDILQHKGGTVWTTTPETTVYDAIRLMGEHNIGALVVLEEGKVAGLLSERDYSRKIVLQGRTSRDTRVGEILTRPILTVTPADPIEACMQLMTRRRVRHLPVVDDSGLPIGLVSIGDLVGWVIQSQHHTIRQLEGFINGGYPG